MAGISGVFIYEDGYQSPTKVEGHGEIVDATGGKKASLTNKARHGEDFYKVQGSKGGKNGNTGGFAANRDLARIAGQKGGRNSSRKGVKNGTKRNTNKHVALPEGERAAQTPSKRKGLFSKLFGN